MASDFDPTARDAGLTLSNDLVQAGATFNDATRLLDGGLWSTPTDNNNQQNYASEFLADIHAVLNDINGDLSAGATVTLGGTPYTLTAADVTALQDVQTQLNTMITEAPLAAAGNTRSAIAAQQALHTADAAVLSDINGDSGLATALGKASYAGTTGATDVGFQAPVAGSDNAAALSAATAHGASLADIGNVFNAASALAVGGLNSSNMGEFTSDLHAIATGLTNLINNPTQLAALEANETPQDAALTTLHLDTVLNQVNLQLNDFDGQYATNPQVAARATNDNLLDIIDIVQNDAALNVNAGGNGSPAAAGGFAEMPGFLSGTTTPFQDNQAQTNFWAQFVAEANTINGQLQGVADGTNTMPISQLITEIQNYQKFGASFDTSQGGIFDARFGNELNSGTLLADTANAVHGLQGIANGDTGAALAADQAQILAAGSGFVADAGDVSGNNLPLGGGTFVGTATTVSGATSIDGLAQGSIPVGPVANGTTGLSSTGTQAGTGGHGGFGGGGFGGGGFGGGGTFGGGGFGAGPAPGETTTVADHSTHWHY